MKATSYDLSVIAYYLSEYDEKAVSELGYANRKEAFKAISVLLERDNNYLKLRRDEFDVVTSSKRKGWRNRPVAPDVKRLCDELSQLDYEEVTKMVKRILADAKKEFERDIVEQKADIEYVTRINTEFSGYSGVKRIRQMPAALHNSSRHSVQTYLRDSKVAANALCNAGYKCEVCSEHHTFLRKANGLPYTEPHHLVPMKAQKDFEVSLDVENNIVSLCSHCHNLLHYGQDSEETLRLLYEQKKELLELAGIIISFEKLKEYY